MPKSALPDRLTRPASSHARTLAGIGLLIAAVACFAILDTTTKRVTAEVPLLMAVWARYFFQAIVTSALVLPKQGLAVLKTDNPGMQVTRGLLLVSVTVLAFSSLQVMPVGEFTAIVMTTPLLVTLLAARLLGEHVSPIRLALVAGGFVGTAIIVRPSGNAVSWHSWHMLLPLVLVMANAAFQLLTSKMTRTESTLTTQFYTSWVGALLTSIPLLWFWTPINDPYLWAGLLLMGVAGAAGHILMIMSFGRSPAATLMPFMYLQIGFAMLGGWIVFDHIPDHVSLIGIALIALCGTAGGLLTLLESRLKKR
jgi:drug/metabolite transporter (DMT)-like permease